MIVEVVVRAPLAARRFRPGQFYRLQNFETLAPAGEGTRLAMEGIALTGAWVDRGAGPHLDDRAGDGRLLRPVPGVEARRAGHPDGADRHADRDSERRDRGARGRRARQRGAVLDRAGDAPGRQPGALLRRLQAHDGPLQARRDRSGLGRGRVVLRRGARVHAGPPAGPLLRRQHRAGHACLRERGARRAADPVPGRRPHHRDRLRPHDGGRRARARRAAEAVPEAAATSRSARSTRRCSA